MKRPPLLAEKDVTGKTAYLQSFSVPFEYPVLFTHGLFENDNPLFVQTLDRLGEKRRHRVAVYADQGVADAHPLLTAQIGRYFSQHSEMIEPAAAPITVPGGEEVKTDWEHVSRVIHEIGNMRLDRQSFVAVIGGGAVIDTVGFAAAIIHRGLRLVRIPTTTLAQNDAGIGVKNGINALGQKNFLGTFAPPFAVINDSAFLPTLDFSQWIAGVAEAFKVAIIKDTDFFHELRGLGPALKNRNLPAMERVVRRCALLHLDHIRTSGDPFEFGSARPLDFGHWAAHKLENMSEYQLGHGQAVAVGIAIDSFAAMKTGKLSPDEFEEILNGLKDCGLPVWHELLERTDSDGTPEVLKGIADFREHLGGHLTLTLPDGIGNKTEVHHLDEQTVTEAIAFLRQRASDRRDRSVIEAERK